MSNSIQCVHIYSNTTVTSKSKEKVPLSNAFPLIGNCVLHPLMNVGMNFITKLWAITTRVLYKCVKLKVRSCCVAVGSWVPGCAVWGRYRTPMQVTPRLPSYMRMSVSPRVSLLWLVRGMVQVFMQDHTIGHIVHPLTCFLHGFKTSSVSQEQGEKSSCTTMLIW